MLSSLALPCLPNDEVVCTTMFLTSVRNTQSIFQRKFSQFKRIKATKNILAEAKRRLSVNDHHNHNRRHHYPYHHHHHCSVWSDVILLRSWLQRKVPRLLR